MSAAFGRRCPPPSILNVMSLQVRHDEPRWEIFIWSGAAGIARRCNHPCSCWTLSNKCFPASLQFCEWFECRCDKVGPFSRTRFCWPSPKPCRGIFSTRNFRNRNCMSCFIFIYFFEIKDLSWFSRRLSRGLKWGFLERCSNLQLGRWTWYPQPQLVSTTTEFHCWHMCQVFEIPSLRLPSDPTEEWEDARFPLFAIGFLVINKSRFQPPRDTSLRNGAMQLSPAQCCVEVLCSPLSIDYIWVSSPPTDSFIQRKCR